MSAAPRAHILSCNAARKLGIDAGDTRAASGAVDAVSVGVLGRVWSAACAHVRTPLCGWTCRAAVCVGELCAAA